MKKMPRLSFWQIWNMSFGFLGIQFGFALQNANASRILQTFGADVEHLNWFWLVAPLTGMIIQPIIGYYSDKTWNKLGRRRPFFLTGAILTSTALILMPNASHFAEYLSPMLIGGGLLMIMDASINISMEPFRALVADKLPEEQHTLGFSVQTLLIGIGAVVGSWLPYILGNFLGFEKEAAEGVVPQNVVWSFYFGATVLISSIVWTVVTTKEYPPEFYEDEVKEEEAKAKFKIPKTMLQLLVVQFFSWFALFSMWVYTTPAVASHFYGATDPHSAAYQEAGDWVGILFGVYNGVSAIIALTLPLIAKRIGRRGTHALALTLGGVAFLSFMLIKDANWLLIPMIGIGIAWGSILAMPYAMLANSIPAKQMGFFMGIFNMSITIPQITNGVFGTVIFKTIYGSNPINAMFAAGIMMLLGAASTFLVDDKLDKKQ